MSEDRKTVRLDVESLPDLETSVSISSSSKQQEVGGAICLFLACGVAVYFGLN